MPFLPQSELLCGGAAATMVLRFWGATGVFPEDFQPLVRPEEGGIRTADLTAEVRSLGWDAVPFRGDPETVRTQIHQGRPVVALIEVGPDRYHFVVIVAWTDGEVVFHDPAESPFQRLPEQTFLSAWRPTNQWALRILPADDGATTRAPEAPERRNPRPRRSEEASRSGSPVSPEPTTGTETESSGSLSDVCAPLLETALDHVREGRPGLAEGRLLEAVERCPDSGRVRAELAGVHARMEAWEEAERAAESAVELAPSSDYAWQILATARYLTGDRTRALAAWNRIGEPRIERVRIAGLDGRAYREAYGRMGLRPDRLLTPDRLVGASRRLSLFPSALESGVRYRPREDGRTEVEATVIRHPVVPGSGAAWAGLLIRGAVSRRISVHSGSPFGLGELWTVDARFEDHRPGVFLEAAFPGLPLLPGVVSVEGGWERQTYRLPGEEGGGPEGGSADVREVTEERRIARLGLTDWATSRLRWELGLGLDRWVGSLGSLDGSLRGGLELRDRGDVLSVGITGSMGISLSGEGGRDYLTGGLHLRWRSSSDPEGAVVHLWADGRAVSEGTPLAYWPGAGEGRAREGLLRAHPLLDGGIIAGEAFGRTLVNAGAEARWWGGGWSGLTLAPAVFVDVGRAGRRLADRPTSGLLVDTGVGLRVTVPGRGGAARVDLARGVTDGGWVLQVGWEAPWPYSF